MIGERLRQFREASLPPSADVFALGRARLPEPLYALFAAQHPRDIRHTAGTARWLLDRGHDGPDLVAAALLHDIGKGQQRRLDRVVYVASCRAGLAERLGAPASRFELRRAVARTLGHVAAAATALEAAGASARTIELTRRHHEPAGDDAELALLQRADAES